MKYTIAAALLPVAWAANIDARQATDLKYEISDFGAACSPDSIYCSYRITIATSNNPEFKQGCDPMATTVDGELPALSETQCGTYTISVAKSDDGGLVLTVNSDMEALTGTFTIPSDDLKTIREGKGTVQEYTGDSTFTIDIKNASSASGSASGTTASNPTASSASSVSPTAASEPSTTGTTTSSSASPSETNGATRESAFAGVLFAMGLMAFIF